MAQINQFNPAQAFTQGRQNALSLQSQEQSIAREREAAPVRNQLAQLKLEGAQRGAAQQETQFNQKQAMMRAKAINQSARAMLGLDPSQRAQAFPSVEAFLEEVGVPAGTFDVNEATNENLQQIIAQSQGLMDDPQAISRLTTGQRDFASNTEGLSQKDIAKARRIKLGLDPRAVGSAVQTITDKGNVEDVSKTEEEISKSKETGKLSAQLKFKPQIQKAVKLAEAAAKERGEVLNDLDRMTATLPSLNDMVDQLRELAPIVTSTFGGRLIDIAVKETGFGSTKGATAKAKFTGIIVNQVLPLLKPTFGGSFTIQEGAELKATMGDPDADPEQKLAQLDAFINQKIRNIEAKQRQLNPESTGELSPEEQEELRLLRLKHGR